jgi:predicted regulator of Ras-like GTPase activity (Roadblock/LC7/MglB family)
MAFLKKIELDYFNKVIRKDLISNGVNSAILIDLSGNIIVEAHGNQKKFDTISLASLAAGNFGAVNALAEILGEKEISLLFHKGENLNIYFDKIFHDFLIILIFHKDISLGFIRLKIDNLKSSNMNGLK